MQEIIEVPSYRRFTLLIVVFLLWYIISWWSDYFKSGSYMRMSGFWEKKKRKKQYTLNKHVQSLEYGIIKEEMWAC